MPSKHSAEARAAFYDKRTKWAEYVSTHADVSDRAFRVGYWLSRRMNGNHESCWYSVAQVARALGKSPRTVASAVAELRAAKVLRVIEEKGKPNTYRLKAPFF